MSLRPGQVLAHYRIVGKIGAGGMGEVYEAVDTQLDRKVALKVLPSGVSRNPDRLERFRREAKAIASINHPNVITIHGIEEAGDRRFLVMELIDGQSLDKKIPAGGMPLRQVFEFAIPMAEALAAAHAKKIIHRDFKPANVMVTAEGQVKVLDFGLAKVAVESDFHGEGAPTQMETRNPMLTGEGVVMGTAPYMSPEQLQSKPIDHRTDIFSLGVVLYEMVSGKRPFQGDSTIALASSILKDTPASVTDMRTDLPTHLGRIIRYCLEKDPDQRFQTARDVRNQLVSLRQETVSEEALSASLPAAPPASTTSRFWWIAAAAVLVVAGALGSFAIFKISGTAGEKTAAPPVVRDSSEDRPTIVVLPFENLGDPDDEYFADGITEEITSRLAALKELGVISRTTAMQYKEDRPTVREIGDDLGVDYVLEGTVRWQRSADGSSRVRVTPQLIKVSDDTHLWAERYDRVLEDIFEVQSDIARKVSEQLGLTLFEPQILSLENNPTGNLEAYDAYLRGNEYLNRGEELFSAEPVHFAIRMYEEAVRLDPGFAHAHARLARAHLFLFKSHDDPAKSRVAAARAAADRALGLDPDLPEAHLALGQILAIDPSTLDRAFEELDLARERDPNNAEIWAEIGDVQTKQGLWEQGIASMKQAMEVNPRLGRVPCSVGGSYWAIGDFDKALLYHQHAIRLIPDRSCPYVCKLWIHLNRDGDTERARAFLEEIPKSVGLEEYPPILYPWVRMEMIDGKYEEALALLFSKPGVVLQFQDYYIPKALLAGQIHGLLGNSDEEKSHYLAAVNELEAKAREWPDDGRVRSALGLAYAGLGRREDAIREAKIGLEVPTEGLLGGTSSYRLRDLAEIYVMLRDTEAAIDQLEELLSKPGFFAAPYLNMDPAWYPLREHPRFRALMKKYLPAAG